MAKAKQRKRKIGIHDRLGHLTYVGACRLMGDGENGANRLRQGAGFDIEMPDDVFLGGDMLRVNVRDIELPKPAIVTVVEMTNQPQGLRLNCDQCEVRCDHMAPCWSSY